jgi:hypothetical protein
MGIVRNRCAAAAVRIKFIFSALGGYSPNLKTLQIDFFDNYINLSICNLDVKKWVGIVRNRCAAAAFCAQIYLLRTHWVGIVRKRLNPTSKNAKKYLFLPKIEWVSAEMAYFFGCF